MSAVLQLLLATAHGLMMLTQKQLGPRSKLMQAGTIINVVTC